MLRAFYRKHIDIRFIALFASIAALIAFPTANTNELDRKEFRLKTKGGIQFEMTVTRPRYTARYATVILIRDCKRPIDARDPINVQMPDLGLAIVELDHPELIGLDLGEQLELVHNWLEQQSWHQRGAVAWISFQGSFKPVFESLLTRPEIQPKLFVQLGEGWSPKATEVLSAFRHRLSAVTHCGFLVVCGQTSQNLAAQEVAQTVNCFQTNGLSVAFSTFDEPRDFGEDQCAAVRFVLQYCGKYLPMSDYTTAFDSPKLTGAEADRFNLAVARAGRRRGELLQIVASAHEPERRTFMVVLGNLEDYDLAHLAAAHLKDIVYTAWRARRTYPWCRKSPLNIFETYVPYPRFYEEELEPFQSSFYNRLRPSLKYAKTTQEAADIILRWMHRRATFHRHPTIEQSVKNQGPMRILQDGGGDCESVVLLFTSLCRSVGIPARVAMTRWPTIDSDHYWTELWSSEDNQWHAVDSSASDRPYNAQWMLRVPKSAIHASLDTYGSWNAREEGRWEAFTNTIAAFYPSAEIEVDISGDGILKSNQPVTVEVPRNAIIDRAITDSNGIARFRVGASTTSKQWYRFCLPYSQSIASQWIEIYSNKTYRVTLASSDDTNSLSNFKSADAVDPSRFK